MIKKIKSLFYFPVAHYFRFFAKIQLLIWKPRIVVITGSSGKTTLLHLIESQIQDKALYSHRANSSYGIPFDILGTGRIDLTPNEWLYLFLMAPFKAFRKPPPQKLYIAEADCDRPKEGKFLATLLRPEITLWVSSSLTHSINFDRFAKEKNFSSVEHAIAYEFGYFLEYSQKLAIVNGDSPLIQKQLRRTQVPVQKITKKLLNSYKVFKDRTDFTIENKKYSIKFLLPKDTFYSMAMTNNLMELLGISVESSFSKFYLPPGRSSLLRGIRNTTLIDSTYNATPDGVKSILEMFGNYQAQDKWLVLGDMIELGDEEQKEHEKLADIINSMKLNNIILVGPRLSKYTYPKLNTHAIGVEKFLMPKDALDYLLTHLRGGEAILFKGARFLEGIIQHLLKNKEDSSKLCRQEKVWKERRKRWGL